MYAALIALYHMPVIGLFCESPLRFALLGNIVADPQRLLN
jgi:hypothetical protein